MKVGSMFLCTSSVFWGDGSFRAENESSGYPKQIMGKEVFRNEERVHFIVRSEFRKKETVKQMN